MTRHRNRLLTRFAAALAALPLLTPPAPAQSALDDVRLDRYEGVARPSRQVMLSTPMDERIKRVLVEEGQAVQAGELVAQMDDAVQRAAVDSAEVAAASEAELRAAEVALDDAELNLERLNQLMERGVANDLELRQAKVEVERQKAGVDVAKVNRELSVKQLELERFRLSRYRVEAPFAGMVHRIHAEEGASLQRADPIAELVALNPIKVELQLPASLYGELTPGRDYALAAGPPVNRALSGRLTYVDPVMDAASETFRFVFEVDNEDLGLPANFTVTLRDLDPVTNAQ